MAEESEKKWETDGVAVEDSNMAMVGSDEDKAARKAAAETEQAWNALGPAGIALGSGSEDDSSDEGYE